MISINDDATYTKSRTVTLTLDASDDSGVASYRVVEIGGEGGISEIGTAITGSYPPADPVQLELSAGDGTKTVAVQYTDTTGNQSSKTTDSIILDTIAPEVTQGAITGTEGGNGWYRSAVSVAYTASDAGSGLADPNDAAI